MDRRIIDCRQQVAANPADATATTRTDAGSVTMILLGHPRHSRETDLAARIGRTTHSPERI